MKVSERLLNKLNLNIVLFLTPICLLGFMNLVNIDKPQISQIENRPLKTMPQFSWRTLASGEFIKDFENYYSDTFVFRETLVKLSHDLKKLKGVSLDDDVSIASVTREKENISSGSTPSQNPSETKTLQETSNNMAVSTPTNPAKNSEAEIMNKYLILGNSAIEIHFYDETTYIRYAQALNTFNTNVGDKVKVYSMIVPTAYEFLENDKYKNLGDPESLGINKANSLLAGSIKRVNAYDALQANSDKYIFFRTDMHWTALGAYYAYTSFMDSIGEPSIPLDKYEAGKLEGYLGTLYGATLNPKLYNNPDTIHYYKPLVQNKFYSYANSSKNSRAIIDFSAAETYDKYCLFLGGLRSRGEIQSNVNNGRKLLVIKDSYGNAFIPYLIPHFSEIYIIDPRAVDINVQSFIKEKGIQEVLFMNYVFSITKEGFADLINKFAKYNSYQSH